MDGTTSRPFLRVAAALGAVAMAAGLLSGCGSSGSGFIHPNVDFSYMRRAAVLPFGNLTSDRLADERMQSIFLMELLQADILAIVDPRETVAAMQALGITSTGTLTSEQAVALGEELSVDALFFGVVEEYGYSQADRRRGPEITTVFGLTETQTGALVWRTQAHSTGTSVWRRLFGGGSADLYSVSVDTVRKALRTLL